MPQTRYLVYSDGSEIQDPGAATYCVAYDDGGGAWINERMLGTTDPHQAVAMMRAEGWRAEPEPGGWYGDDRDESFRLTR